MNLRIGLVQINSFVGNFEYNFNKIREYIKKAKNYNCDIVVFPELAITGYPPEDLLLKPRFILENLQYFKKVSRLCDNIICIIGFVEKKEDKIYNAAGVIHNKSIIDIYHKINLPNYGVFDEKRYFNPGNRIPVYDIGKIRFGLGICEDIWVDDSPVISQARDGKTSFIININASPYYIKKWKDRLDILENKAKITKNYIFYLNMVGGQDEIVFDGHSLVLNPEGKLIYFGKQFVEDFVLCDINVKEKKSFSESKRIKLIKIKNFKPKMELQKIIYPSVRTSDFLSTEEEIYTALVLGTRDYVYKNNFTNVVIGLSGGIDSALTAVIAVDALGRDNVTTLFMPSMFSSKESFKDAKKVAENLGVKFWVVPINKIFKSYLKTLKPFFRGLPFDITEENLQARIRGNILMAFSNKFKFLVLTTGNKSEMSTGYATLYGDMAGGFAVIKDVPKTMIYKLVEYRNSLAGYDLIPENIIKKPPTAELRKEQKDTDTLPEYEILDRILYYYIERYLSYREIVAKGFDKEIVRKVISMVDRSEYKRRQAPPGIKITKVAFGKDRRMPITNGYFIK